jgi:lysophospholipase L1-like esterase
MGGGNMGSYRTDLYRLLTNDGLSIDFVGSQKGGPSTLPDRDNEGHSGWTIPQISSKIDGWMRSSNPDVVFLWIGGNDVFQTGKINTTGLANLIDQIFTIKPDVTLFVADYYPWPDMVKEYNAVIPGVVQQKANAGKNVHFVKLSDIQFNRNTDISSDGLHLSEAGYTKTANLWYKYTIDKLKSLAGGSTPTTPPISTPTNPPQGKKGDINSDGQIDSTDYALLKRYLLSNVNESMINQANADINNDNSINSTDYALLKRIILGTIQI